MDFKYVRIQGNELAKNTMYAKGIFSMCWQLVQQDVMEKEDADLFKEIDTIFRGLRHAKIRRLLSAGSKQKTPKRCCV